MNPDEIKKRLRDDEKEALANTSKTTITTKTRMSSGDSFDMYFLSAADLELLRDRLIEERKQHTATRKLSEQRRELMEKHEWIKHVAGMFCPECGRYQARSHTPDCLWAKAIHMSIRTPVGADGP